ncbi:MAG: DUF1893 domain-containing protein [Rikenellaceae bacterium]|nr:DUF1893 domain-containing protein [Rikenellaceae bacterium]
MKTEIELAKNHLKNYGYSLVVVKDGVELVSKERGIMPLLKICEKNQDILEGAVLADKVIGKAAAFIICKTKLKEVYAEVMSESAVQVLSQAGIKYGYGRLVSEIMNRDGSDLCPMENLCRNIDTPHEGIMAITNFINKKKRGSDIGAGDTGEHNV